MRPSGDAETAVTSLFGGQRSNGDGARRRRRANGVSGTATFTAITAPAPIEIAPAPAASALRTTTQTSITARHALERALLQVAQGPIAVVGEQSIALAEWLRRSGRSAEIVAEGSGEARHENTSRPASRWPVIVAAGAFEHAAEPSHLVRSVRRMLTPDGRVLVVLPNPTHASHRLAMLRGQYPRSLRNAAAPTHPFTATEIEDLLERGGLAVVATERELDSADILKEIGAGFPESVLAVLADDADALTSAFVIVAGLQGASSTRLLHRRVRELANEQHAAARMAERLGRRVAQLETRHGAAASMPLPSADHEQPALNRQAMADALTTIERLDRELRSVTDRLAARELADAGRDEALRRASEPLKAAVGEVTSLIGRIEKSRYARLVTRVRQIVGRALSRGSIVAVITRGDPDLLTFDGRRGWHFPQTETGVYAGHHPADSNAAIAHLEHIRSKGARYLLIPRTSFWWLEHYREFNEHLLRRYRCVLRDEHTCMLFALGRDRA